MGHVFSLGHPCLQAPDAVMCADYTTKQTLAHDDKNGISQLFGPWTGFEDKNAQGLQTTLAFPAQNVIGYNQNNSPPPALASGPAELGVPVISGSRYNRMWAYATACYSYAYFRLFSDFQDRSASPLFFTIRPGAKLVWDQYNYEQATMSVDFAMTDGTTLRDSGLRDTNGVLVHPAYRRSYPMNTWRTHTVDLSSLSGKQVREWYIAYDSGNIGYCGTGRFRGYFDNIRIEESRNVAKDNAAIATASTTYPSTGCIYDSIHVVDNISHRWGFGEWASTEYNPWIKLTWSSSQAVTKIRLFDRPAIGVAANSGTLTFSDGSSINVTGIPDNGDPKEISFPTKNITWVKFQITGGTGNSTVGLAEFQALAN